MISTKNLTSELKDVPREWVYEFYLKLNEQLSGQDLKIKSVFNVQDKTPSMCIYYSKTSEKYKFKDFSTGKEGDGVSLVQNLFSLTTRGEAAHKIISDYNHFILNNKEDIRLKEFKIQQKYKVTHFVKRSWTNVDQKFWTDFHIGSKLLEYYQVFPLESYTMTKDVDGIEQQLVIQGRHYIYGYFRLDGSLYKIYQPMVKENKFIKVKEYIQGTDQLTFIAKYLVICSSLKDMMCLTKLGYKNIEVIAPDSENVLIQPHIMTAYDLKYDAICCLFDNDTAGIECMAKYSLKYNIPGVLLPLAKDISDSMKQHGILVVKQVLTPLLKEALK